MFDGIINLLSPETTLSRNDLKLLEKQLRMNTDLDPIFKSKALRNIRKEKLKGTLFPDDTLNSLNGSPPRLSKEFVVGELDPRDLRVIAEVAPESRTGRWYRERTGMDSPSVAASNADNFSSGLTPTPAYRRRAASFRGEAPTSPVVTTPSTPTTYPTTPSPWDTPPAAGSATDDVARMMGDIRRGAIPTTTVTPASGVASSADDLSRHLTTVVPAPGSSSLVGVGVDSLPDGETLLARALGEAPRPTPAATTIASSADDLAQLQTDRLMMNYLADGAKNADEGFDLMRWLAKSGDEINAGATKALPLGKALGALGIAVDAGTTAYDVWHENPYQSNEAKLAESLGAGLGAGSLGFWGGLKAGSMAGTAFGPVGTLLGGLAGGVIGSQAGKFLGKGIGELAVGGFDLDDGRKENIKKLKREAIEDQIEEMKMIARAQQEIERENAIFNQSLAQQALFEQTMMQMMMNGSMNTGNANAAQMIQAMYG